LRLPSSAAARHLRPAREEKELRESPRPATAGRGWPEGPGEGRVELAKRTYIYDDTIVAWLGCHPNHNPAGDSWQIRGRQFEDSIRRPRRSPDSVETQDILIDECSNRSRVADRRHSPDGVAGTRANELGVRFFDGF